MSGSGERDRSIERLLREPDRSSPRAEDAGATDGCLDAETLAAWVDNGLSGESLRLAQTHLADCVRCQTVVGTLARTDLSGPQPKPATSSRWLGWIVPLTAGAAAVLAAALWVAVPRVRNATATLQSSQSADTGPSAPAIAAPSTLSDRKDVPSATDSSATTPAPASPPAVPGVAAENNRKQSAVAPNATALPDRPSNALSESVKVDAAAAPAPALRGAAGRGGSQNTPASATGAASSAAAPSPAPSSAAASTFAAPAVPAVSPGIATAQAQVSSRSATVEILSPDPAVRWRITGSIVTHSTNGGSRWENAPTGNTVDLTAGVAPSSSVCWIVGRAGVVLLSTDGVRWRRVTFPEAVDLAAIRAVDERRASVSTVDGRVFSTNRRRLDLVSSLAPRT